MPGRTAAQNFGRSAVLALSAMLLGLALQVNDGLYSPLAVALLAISGVVCVAGLLLQQTVRGDSRRLAWFVATLVGAQLVVMFFHRAGASETTVPPSGHGPMVAGLCVALAALGLITLGNRHTVIVGFVLLLTTFAALGVWKIRAAPHPQNDIYLVHVDAAQALSRGINPYTITFRDIYGPDAHVYDPRFVRDGKLQFGYTYPPIPLMLTSAAHIVLGDFRYAQLLAMLAMAIFLAMIRPNRIGMLIAALLVFTPRSFYVIETGWTEPISAMLLAGTVWCAERRSKQGSASLPISLPMSFGLLLASKQYLPAALLFPSIARGQSLRVRLGVAGFAVLTIIVATLPFLVWDFRAFGHSVIEVQLHGPYRADALSFAAWWGARHPGWIAPSWPGFAALLAALAVAHWRRLSFTAAFVLCYFAFFAFGRQAFANYYYLIMAAIACEICAVSPIYGRREDLGVSPHAHSSLPIIELILSRGLEVKKHWCKLTAVGRGTLLHFFRSRKTRFLRGFCGSHS
jgi:hypothetical protein